MGFIFFKSRVSVTPAEVSPYGFMQKNPFPEAAGKGRSLPDYGLHKVMTCEGHCQTSEEAKENLTGAHGAWHL